MINVANIAAYIQYLYQQKYHASAPEEVIHSWSQLPEDELQAQLSALYQHWGMDQEAAARYEQEFVHQAKKETSVSDFFAPPPPPVTPLATPYPAQQSAPAYTPPGAYTTVAPPKSNAWKTIAIVAILILLAAGGILAYQLYQNQQQNDTAGSLPPTTDTSVIAMAPVPEPEPEPMVTSLPMDDTDELNAESIQQLLAAEDAQQLETILSLYAPYMERYWDIKYPTQDQLIKRYEDSWQKIADARNEILDIRKMAPNTYDVDIRYSFYQISKETNKTLDNTLRFVLNEDHQITQVYKLK